MASSIKTIAGLVDAVAAGSPTSRALVSPFQSHEAFTYEKLAQTTNRLAAWLKFYGYEPGSVLMSDLPNVSENLIVQLACNRIGVHYATCKSLEAMATFPRVHGAIASTSSGFLAETNLPIPPLSGDYLSTLILDGGVDEWDERKDVDSDSPLSLEDAADGADDASTEDGDSIHAFYNSTTGYTNGQALHQGLDAAAQLEMKQDDVVCVSITLCHAFGIGSAVCSALSSGATIVLPAVGGIQGCGVPSERAAATLEVLESEKCSLMFADTHTLKALPTPESPLDALRGGACKIGSGSTFLDETVDYAGVQLRTVGKK